MTPLAVSTHQAPLISKNTQVATPIPPPMSILHVVSISLSMLIPDQILLMHST